MKLTRKPTGDNFEFKGQISIGQTVTEVNSTDNSDISEKEFLDNQTTDDGITAAPKDFTEVSPESIGVRVKLDAAADFLKSLKGQDVEVSLDEPRRHLRRAARRRADHHAQRRSGSRRGADRESQIERPGVIAAGWTTGIVEMDRTIRFSAAPTGATATGSTRTSSPPTIANVLAKSLFGQTCVLGVEHQHRQTETDVQAPKRSLSRRSTSPTPSR